MLTGYPRPKKVEPPVKGLLVVENSTRGTRLVDKGSVADTAVTRTRGLLKHTHLERGDALLIVPCSSIHSFGMKFNFDAVFMDRNRKVIHLISDMRPGQISWMYPLFMGITVLETPSGVVVETGTQVGDQMALWIRDEAGLKLKDL